MTAGTDVSTNPGSAEVLSSGRLHLMDDVIAVEVRLADGAKRYFLTWDESRTPVDPQPVCDLVLRHSRAFALDGDAASARLCGTLPEASDSAHAPSFYECFLGFASKSIPFGEKYEGWRASVATEMEAGREISYSVAPQPESDNAERLIVDLRYS